MPVGEIHHSCRNLAAFTGVHDSIQEMIKAFHDLPTLRQRPILARHDQGARYQGFTEARDYRLSDYMIRNAHTDRTSPGLQHSFRNFAACRDDECVLPWRGRLEGTKDHIVEVYEPAKLIEVCAYECEVMSVVQLPDLSNPFQARPVIKLTAKCEAGVRWVGDQPVSAQQLDHLADRSRLRIVRVDIEVSGHEIERSGRPAKKSVDEADRTTLASKVDDGASAMIQRPSHTTGELPHVPAGAAQLAARVNRVGGLAGGLTIFRD